MTGGDVREGGGSEGHRGEGLDLSRVVRRACRVRCDPVVRVGLGGVLADEQRRGERAVGVEQDQLGGLARVLARHLVLRRLGKRPLLVDHLTGRARRGSRAERRLPDVGELAEHDVEARGLAHGHGDARRDRRVRVEASSRNRDGLPQGVDARGVGSGPLDGDRRLDHLDVDRIEAFVLGVEAAEGGHAVLRQLRRHVGIGPLRGRVVDDDPRGTEIERGKIDVVIGLGWLRWSVEPGERPGDHVGDQHATRRVEDLDPWVADLDVECTVVTLEADASRRARSGFRREVERAVRVRGRSTRHRDGAVGESGIHDVGAKAGAHTPVDCAGGQGRHGLRGSCGDRDGARRGGEWSGGDQRGAGPNEHGHAERPETTATRGRRRVDGCHGCYSWVGVLTRWC